jgi:hypothetical protein
MSHPPSPHLLQPDGHAMSRDHHDPRNHRDLHALDADGMLVCNPRDKEAAHRAEVEGIATDRHADVTCSKCRALLRRG